MWGSTLSSNMGGGFFPLINIVSPRKTPWFFGGDLSPPQMVLSGRIHIGGPQKNSCAVEESLLSGKTPFGPKTNFLTKAKTKA